MLGRKTVEAAVVYGGAPVIEGANQLTAGELELSFYVEEEEMLIDLELNVTLTATAGDLDATFLVDGTNLGGGTAAALMRMQATGSEDYVSLRKTVRLAKGQHTVEAQLANAGAPTLNGDVVPGELVARRHSHPATLGHGVDSKAQLIQ